jgi:hypothetical protein
MKIPLFLCEAGDLPTFSGSFSWADIDRPHGQPEPQIIPGKDKPGHEPVKNLLSEQ